LQNRRQNIRPLQNFRLLNIKGMKFGCENQWKSWCTARNLCFNKKFQKKLYHFNRNSQLGSVIYKMIQLDIRSRNKIRLRLVVLLGIRLHPKTSDSAILLRRARLDMVTPNRIAGWTQPNKQDCWLVLGVDWPLLCA